MAPQNVVGWVVLAAIGYGLWTLRQWARRLWLFLTGVGMPFLLFLALFAVNDGSQSAYAFKWFVFFYVLIAVVLWIYLTRPKISAAFRKSIGDVVSLHGE
jgi:hypothetical protein